MFTLGFIYLFISSDFLPKSSVNNLWSQLTTSFHIAAYATSGFGVTPSEESSIRPLPHTYTHDWLVFRWLIRARVYDIPPTLKAWLVCCFGLLVMDGCGIIVIRSCDLQMIGWTIFWALFIRKSGCTDCNHDNAVTIEFCPA